MTKLNFTKLMAVNPTKYGEQINQLGQFIEFFEHPTEGDYYPVIAVYRAEKLAIYTDFFDTSDFYKGSDYNYCYMHGSLECAYLFDL